MADLESKNEDNIVGRYFVDEECIDCDACRGVAPANFKRNEEEGYSFVYKQPENEEEERECEESLKCCPVEAIGDFGS